VQLVAHRDFAMNVKFLKAGNGDAIFCSFNDEQGIKRNILIDGGVTATYQDMGTNKTGELKTLIESLKATDQQIDLLILTHIDNDHICGLLKWFAVDEQAPGMIKNAWFNSAGLIAKYFDESENPQLLVELNIFQSGFTGVEEAISFEKYLNSHDYWNQKLIMTGTELKQDGITIQVLSPNKTQLKSLSKLFPDDYFEEAYTGKAAKDWDTDLQVLVQEEAEGNIKFIADKSPKNGSSIAFILTVNKKHFLFLADAHPGQVVKALKALKITAENPLEVEFMKLSHHGSNANTSPELLQLVKTNNYIISTNGSGHGHPNKRTLARILTVNPAAVFYFNYEHLRDEIFSDKDFEFFPELQARLTEDFNLK
jgi:beta-lactamase superfamily II metal-dependent hydrolase